MIEIFQKHCLNIGRFNPSTSNFQEFHLKKEDLETQIEIKLNDLHLYLFNNKNNMGTK